MLGKGGKIFCKNHRVSTRNQTGVTYCGWRISCTTNLGWFFNPNNKIGTFTTVFNWCRISQPSTAQTVEKLKLG